MAFLMIMNVPDFAKLKTRLTNPNSLVTDLAGWEAYFQDATEETGRPAAVVLAESESDVVATVRFARKTGLPVIPRGAGTGLSGGCVPSPGSLVLSTERMKKLEIDATTATAVCGPGVITKELLDAAAPHGLTYPPDPASYAECTLGGNVAENAGGLRCKRFGVTRDYIIGLRAVAADGSVIATGACNNQRGFALGDILIGSEGTLAIVTEIAVRLIPTPSVGGTILAAFDDPTDAARTVSEITEAGIIPTVMEYLDGDAAECSNRYEKTEGLDRVAAILLIETTSEAETAQADAIRGFCEQNHASYLRTATDPARVEELWRIRRNLSKAVREMARFRYNEDVAVPVSRFMTLIEFVAELNASSPLRVNAFGHAGNGNLHVSFLSMTGDEDEIGLIKQETERLYRKTLALGGTLTGEHGIGSHKAAFLPWEFDPPTLEFMRRIKEVFDPEGLLNPGKILPAE